MGFHVYAKKKKSHKLNQKIIILQHFQIGGDMSSQGEIFKIQYTTEQ